MSPAKSLPPIPAASGNDSKSAKDLEKKITKLRNENQALS